MKKGHKQIGYPCVVFCSFSIAFFILSFVNIFFPVSDFKMTVLSVVAVLLSLQQLFEASEEMDNKISDLEKAAAYQGELLDLIDPPLELPPPPTSENNAKPASKSRWIFAVSMIILIVGLTLDFDFQNGIIANTSTIASFAVIFLTMGYKEHYAARINRLNERQHTTNRRIITKLREQIDSLKKL